MKIQKKLFTLTDTWPWAIILTIILGILLAAIHRYISIKPTATEVVQLVILGVVAFLMVFFIGYRYDEREMAIKSWNRAFQTKQGTAIIPDLATYSTIRNLKWYKESEWGASSQDWNPLYRKIEEEIDNCCSFWNSKYAKGDKLAELQAAFSGGTISIVNKPFYVNFIGKVMGTQIGQNIQVVFDGQKVQTEDQLIQLIRHECSHLCLTVLGAPETNEVQHALMKDYNFG